MLNTLLSNALYTIHQGQAGGRGLSPRLWGHARNSLLSPDGAEPSFAIGDDFLNHGAIAAAANDVNGGYAAYIDTGNTINAIATEKGGVVRFLTDTTDNDECWLTSGGNTGVLAPLPTYSTTTGKVVTANTDKLTIFEARIRLTQVTDTYNVFVGLAEEGLAAADTISDAGAIADKDYIGFHIKEGNGDALTFAYNKAGGTDVTVLTYGTALEAATWYKLGFIYDPNAPGSKKIKIYIDNVEQSTYVTLTNMADTTNFPGDEELAFLAGLKNGAAAAKSFDMDWWQFFQAG